MIASPDSVVLLIRSMIPSNTGTPSPMSDVSEYESSDSESDTLSRLCMGADCAGVIVISGIGRGEMCSVNRDVGLIMSTCGAGE